MVERVGIVGPGRLGSHLFRSLSDLGLDVCLRTREDATPLSQWVADREVILLCVRDDQIEPLAQSFEGRLEGKVFLICSGVAGLDKLAVLSEKGAVTGKFHPLQAFSVAQQDPVPRGTPFAFEGPITHIISSWLSAWGCKGYPLEGEQWRAYHLAAVMAANFLPLFIRAGARILEPLAENQADALSWLGPLVQTTVAQALDSANPLPFSGPAIRGDVGTIAAHLELLERDFPELVALYRLPSDTIMEMGSEDS